MAKFTVSFSMDLDAEDAPQPHGLIRSITDKSIKLLRDSTYSGRHGVYIFWIRVHGGHEIPWYVGMAKGTTLGSESTSRDKLLKYALAMMQRTGVPGMTFLVAKRKSKSIDHLERFIIWLAQHRNDNLLNLRKIDSSPVSLIDLLGGLQIPGVLNSSSGQPSVEAIRFRALMGLNS